MITGRVDYDVDLGRSALFEAFASGAVIKIRASDILSENIFSNEAFSFGYFMLLFVVRLFCD